jgi:acyl-CoA synthetase (AMP-forming)/AMP-acid ligase II
MIYTGGTTGMPKGVLWRHEDFYHNVICMNAMTEKPEDILEHANPENPLRSFILSPLMHGGGQFAVFITILRGGVAIVPVSRSLDPDEILTTIARENVAMLSVIGDAMARPIAEAKIAGDYNTDCLSIVSSGGAVLTAPARELLKKAFGDHIFMTGGVGGSEIGNAAVESGAHDKTTGPCFQPNALMAVLNEKLEPIAPGSDEVGVLAMKGSIPLGYYNDPIKTAEVFKTDAAGVRWVLPGDRATVNEDGTFTLVGRDSQCINSGGEKIFVEEVERAVAMHPAVRFCAVTGVPDPQWMQSVAAVVELESGEALELEALQAHCRNHIAGYKIPRHLFVVQEFRRTPNGKIDYGWVKGVAEGPAQTN